MLVNNSRQWISLTGIAFVGALLASTATFAKPSVELVGSENTQNAVATIFASIEEEVSTGYQLFEAGDLDGALALFDSAVSQDAEYLSALLGKGMIHAQRMEHVRAFSAYDMIVQSHPTHALAWNRRGLAAFNMEQFELALESFVRATETQPVNGFYYESIAWVQMCLGQYNAALQSAKTASLMYSRLGETSLYPVLIVYLASLQTKDLNTAQRAMVYAQKNRGSGWPGPVVNYLNGSMCAAQLISCVTTHAQETEAHVYIGINLSLQGDHKAADRHLDWVSREGDPRVFEYTLARALQMEERLASL